MTKKSKAEQVEEKVQDAAPAAEQAEQMEGADAARQPSEEELKAMLRGENRQHDEALGDAWAVLLGQNPMAVMPQVVGTVLHDGGTRPAWQWKRSGKDYVLMAWPKDQPSRAAVLMQADEGEKFKPLSAVPFLEGLPNDLTVEDIHPWSQGGGANVAVSMIEGKNPMWFYDPLYLRDKDDLTPGVTQTFLLSGLAIALRKALLDDVNITQGPQYEAWAAQWLAENRQDPPGRAAPEDLHDRPSAHHARPPLCRIPGAHQGGARGRREAGKNGHQGPVRALPLRPASGHGAAHLRQQDGPAGLRSPGRR